MFQYISKIFQSAWLLLLGWALVLAGGLLAYTVQTAGGVAIRDLAYPGAHGERLSARLYRPASATPDHPAPAVLISHGYINTREMQSPFAIELARRGFVVLAIDMAGHGASGGYVGEDDDGGPAGLAQLRALPFVDPRQIGLEAHSMGGVAVVGAALAQPDGYRSMVLEGSTTPDLGQLGAGSPNFPRNLAVVFGRWDEFAPLMWKTPRGDLVGTSPKMRALFGVAGAVVPGRLYGNIAAGTARELVIPRVDHPMEHFSSAGVGAAIDWFQRTLTGEASPKPPGDQIWLAKEIGTLIGLVGFGCVLLGSFEALLALPGFADLRRPAAQAAQGSVARGPRWAVGVFLSAAVPAASFFSLMGLGFALLPSRIFPEWVGNQILLWGVVNAVVGVIVGAILGGRRGPMGLAWIKGAVAGLLCVAMGYLALAASLALFRTDFRFWVVALRPLDGRHLADFLAFAPAFVLVFAISMRNLARGVLPPVRGWLSQYAWAKLAMAGGFVVLLAVQYASLMIRGALPDPKEALNTIIAIQFVPLLAFTGVVGVFVWRRTGGYAASAVICGLTVAWYVSAGTATHWRPGWTLTPSAGLYPARPAAAASPDASRAP